MGLKGKILSNHIPKNNYELIVNGLSQSILFTEIGGISEELEIVELPDRTVASGGNTKSTEMTAMQPSHHDVEVAQMEEWFKECQDPVAPTYKKTATLIKKAISGEIVRSYTLQGIFPKQRALQDLSLENEGEMDTIEWTFSIDDVLPL
jgi:hypothetical protein